MATGYSLATLAVALDELSATVDTLIPSIGKLEIRMDDIDPSTIYPNTTWSLLTGAATLSLGDGTIQDGVVVGSNEHTLAIEEVPAHAHTGTTASSTFTGEALPSHTHTYQTQPLITVSEGGGNDGTKDQFETDDTGGTSAGTPSGTVSTTVTVASEGGGLAHNIQSAHVDVNVWQRTA